MSEFPNAYRIGTGERAHWRFPKSDLDAYKSRRAVAAPRHTTQATQIVTT